MPVIGIGRTGEHPPSGHRVSSSTAPTRPQASTGRQGGGLDVLVNRAGIEERKADGGVFGAGELTGNQIRTIFETNVFGWCG